MGKNWLAHSSAISRCCMQLHFSSREGETECGAFKPIWSLQVGKAV